MSWIKLRRLLIVSPAASEVPTANAPGAPPTTAAVITGSICAPPEPMEKPSQSLKSARLLISVTPGTAGAVFSSSF